MSTDSTIEWTDATWSPTTGCDRVSPGCDNCYALTLAKRLKTMRSAKYQRDGDPRTSGPGFGLTVHADALDLPLRWRKPRRVFVNSMSDLFHKDVPDKFIGSVFDVMARTPQHTYQILTKRHGRMRSLLNRWADDDWTWRRNDAMWCGPVSGPLPNVHLGVSVEDQKHANLRIPALMDTPAAVRFLSCEPLLSGVNLSEWLLVGSQDGNQRGEGASADHTGCTECGRPGTSLAASDRHSGFSNRGAGGSMRTTTSRHRTVGDRGVPENSSHGRDGAGNHTCTPNRVDGGEPTDDPSRVRGESQERSQGRQPSGEPRTDHACGQYYSRTAYAGPVQGVASREAHPGAGGADPSSTRQQASFSGTGCGAVRGQHGDGQEDRATRVVGVDSGGIDWVIVGGESGPGSRPLELDWVRSIVNQCRDAGVPVFVKQDSGPRPGMQGRIPDGLWIKEFPHVT